MCEVIQIILAVTVSAAIVLAFGIPFVSWCDKVKKEMGEEDHYDD